MKASEFARARAVYAVYCVIEFLELLVDFLSLG
jgi:hypothetical protein